MRTAVGLSATAALVAAVCLGGCSVDGRQPLGSAPSLVSGAGVDGEGEDLPAPAPAAESSAPPEPSAPSEPAAPSELPPAPDPAVGADPAVVADLAAGVLEARVPEAGPGTTTVVPGSTPASQPAAGPDRAVSVRVEVEDGLPVDGGAFAAFAMATLSDPRGWGREGWSFARTDADADVVLTLASPATSARMCAPLDTGGTLSCRNGDDVVLTHHRWVNGAEAYGADRTSYRQYLVSHEVGHALGKAHVGCPGPGQPAPVMLQQTKGVGECTAQPWPYP